MGCGAFGARSLGSEKVCGAGGGGGGGGSLNDVTFCIGDVRNSEAHVSGALIP